jgi:NADH:ubiquinone oxidoreductase subunit E
MAKRQPWDVDRGQSRIQELERLPAALLPILHALQDESGYADKAAIPLIASALNLSHVDGARRPRSTNSKFLTAAGKIQPPGPPTKTSPRRAPAI